MMFASEKIASLRAYLRSTGPKALPPLSIGLHTAETWDKVVDNLKEIILKEANGNTAIFYDKYA